MLYGVVERSLVPNNRLTHRIVVYVLNIGPIDEKAGSRVLF